MATQTNQTKSIEAAPADTIAESKLARIQLIAKEALDLLGEDTPEELRQSHAQTVGKLKQQIAGLEARLAGAAEQLRGVEGDLRHAQRLAQDRLEEAEKVWDVAADQAKTIQSQESLIESREAELTQREESIRELKDSLDEAMSRTQSLKDEIASERSKHDAAERKLARKVEELGVQIRAHESSLAQLGTELARATEERDQALTTTEETETELARVREELETKSQRLTESQASLRATREQLEEIEIRAEASRAQAETLDAQLTAMSAEVEALRLSEDEARTELASVRTEIADLSARLADRDQTIARLSQRQAPALTPAPSPVIETKPTPPSFDIPEEIQSLREALDAKETEAAFMREQMDRADERADRYRDEAEQAQQSLEKANAIVMRARRRAAARTQQYAQTIEAMSALHVKYDVAAGDLRRAESRAARHLTVARLCGAAAGLTGLLAVISAF